MIAFLLIYSKVKNNSTNIEAPAKSEIVFQSIFDKSDTLFIGVPACFKELIFVISNDANTIRGTTININAGTPKIVNSVMRYYFFYVLKILLK